MRKSSAGDLLYLVLTAVLFGGRTSAAATTSAALVDGHVRNGSPVNSSNIVTSGVSGVITKIPPGAVVLAPGQVGTLDPQTPTIKGPTTSGTMLSPAVAQPGVGTCTAYNATNPNGGSVVSVPRINLLFWGVWNQTAANAIVSTWKTLSATPAFFNREAEYGIQNGSFGQRFPDYTSGASGSQPDCVFAGGLSATLNAAHFVPTANDVFIIYLPANTSSKLDTDAYYDAHHCSYNYGDGLGATCWNYIDASCGNTPPTGCCNNMNGVCSGVTYNDYLNTCTSIATGQVYPLNVNGAYVDLHFAIIENSVSATMPVASHEFAEMTTDPDGVSFAEIGDICQAANIYNFQNPLNSIRGIPVQKIWSQDACRCVGERDLNSVGIGGAASVPTLYRPSNQLVYPYGLPNDYQLFPAGSAARPFAWDHDGDGLPDYATFFGASAPASIASRPSVPPSSQVTYVWGTAGDIAVPGDYDGDGLSDLAVWRPSNGNWIIRYSSNSTVVTTQFGISTDIPVPGDYDGDGKTDYAVMRPSNGTLYAITSAGGGFWENWAITSGDIPVPADYNGDGLTDYAFWRPSNGTFYVWYLGTNTAWTQGWGAAGDVPVVRDYDGDWLADLAVWRPSSGTWYTINSSNWGTTAIQWGASSDVPIQRFTASGGF
jgi:hypothetical protein